MANIGDLYPSSYLKSSDIGDRRVSVILDRLEVEEMGDGTSKPVLYFRGKERGLVLNKTNANTLSEAYGYDYTQWAGQGGVLFTVDTEFGGRRTKGIRIDSGNAPAPVLDPPSDDDLPF